MAKLHEGVVTRREFTSASVMAMLAGVVVTISGCGGAGSSPTASATPPATTPGTTGGDRTGTISANHGHIALITGAQISTGGAIDLNIQGSADHAHTVRITTDDLRALSSGTRVSHESTDNAGHSHTVTFN